MSQLLLSLTVYDPTIPGNTTVRGATGGTYNHPSAAAEYQDRINGRSQLGREVFRDGIAFGSSQMDYGKLLLANADGWLDWFVENDCAVDDRAVTLDYLETDNDDIANAIRIFTGTAEQLMVGLLQAELILRDSFAKIIDTPVQSTRFAGNNSLPNGVEGVDDIKNRWKPVLYGYAFNFAPPCVNTSNYIYQLADKAIQSIITVRDKGAVLTAGVSRASVADLIANAPGANKYDWCFLSTGSYIKLGSVPVGQITVDAQEGTNASDRTVAQIWKRVLVDRAGVSAGSISSADITAMDTAASGEAGFWAYNEITVRDQLDELVGGAAACYTLDASGTWRIFQIPEPGAATADIVAKQLTSNVFLADGEIEIISLQPIYSTKAEGALPFKTVEIGYNKNYTKQSKDALAGVALTDLQKYEREYLVEATDVSGVSTKHPLSKTIKFDSCFKTSAGASAMLTHFADLFGVSRRRYACSVKLDATSAAALDLGNVVEIHFDRFDLSSGKNFVITKIVIDMMALTADLTLWG